MCSLGKFQIHAECDTNNNTTSKMDMSINDNFIAVGQQLKKNKEHMFIDLWPS